MTPLSKLDEIAKITDNWDGYGASAAPKTVIDNAMVIIEEASSVEPEITLTTAGTIELEWRISGSLRVDVEVGIEWLSVIVWRDSVIEETMFERVSDSGFGELWARLGHRRG